jgi:hypothetical protein
MLEVGMRRKSGKKEERGKKIGIYAYRILKLKGTSLSRMIY